MADNNKEENTSEGYKTLTKELYKRSLELVKLNKDIENLNQELRAISDAKTNLIHIINHQIKGYLSKGRNIFSELLVEPDYGPISENAKPMLDEGFKSLTDGVEFVNNFLDQTTINKGTYEYKMESVDFKAIVLEMADKQKDLALEKKLSFEVNVADGDYKMIADKTQLPQAVKNLINNSILYTPKGSISVNLSRDGGRILFSVKDTGVGLSEELKPRLFTEGGRGKDSLKANVNSTGYGLSFVKSVIEAHKGRVWAESEGEGKGSTFYLELPVS